MDASDRDYDGDLVHGYGEGDGEVFYDVVKREMRRRRGAREVSRGPMSGAVGNLQTQFDKMIADMYRMHGELTDRVAIHLNAEMAARRVVMRRYFFVHVRHPTAEDWEALQEELAVADYVVDEGDDFDLGDLS